MAGSGVQFPAFLKLEYDGDSRATNTMLADIDRALGSAKARFQSSFAEISRIMQSSMSGFERGNFKFNKNGFPIQDMFVFEVAKDGQGRVSLKTIAKPLTNHPDAFVGDCKL